MTRARKQVREWRKKKAADGAAPEASTVPEPFPEETDEAAPFPETDEAAPVAPPRPQAGERVAVGVEHLLHCLRMGEAGRCLGAAPGDPDNVMLRLDNLAVLKPVRIPRVFLVPVGKPMRTMRMWDKCSDSVKRDMLSMVGVRDPRDEVLPSTPAFMLTLWGEYVPIGLRFNEALGGVPLRFVQLAFVKAFAEAAELMGKVKAGAAPVSFAEVERQVHRQGVRERLLKEWWNQNEVLLLCLCDEASNSSALLAVRKTPPSVRFYEAGNGGVQAIGKLARLMLGNLEGVPDEVPPRCNCCTTGHEVLIAIYIEAEMREASGETRGCLGWPPHLAKKRRGHLRGLRLTLEASRKKWCDAENAIEAKRRHVTELTVAKALRSEERRKAFEDRWSDIKARTLKALDEGSFEGPIVPIGFKPPEAPTPKAPSEKAWVEKASFLHVDEPPEGMPRVRGGASGSGDHMPPEAPPPEAPPPEAAPPLEAAPPEAPPPELRPSKGDEVKRAIAEAPARLEKKAYVALEDEFIAAAKLEDLREQDRAFYEKVRSLNTGVCPRCRWEMGCLSCDEAKAWDYARRSTLWHTAHEAVRPTAKPRGRPKKAAK